jgi:ferredoxin
MAELIINDASVQAEVGEDILTVARRNRAHIGFVCDGNGLCTTCECRVFEGSENLSEPNDVEYDWLLPSRIARGHRLGCQAVVIKEGRIALVTRAEEFRQLWRAVNNPPPGTTSDQNWTRLIARSTTLTADYFANFPLNLLRTANRIGLVRMILPVRNNTRYLRDVGRIIDRTSGDRFSDANVKPRVDRSRDY